MGNLFVTLGIILLLTGIVMNVFPHIKLPLLPGDLFVKRENFTFYFPIVTSIIVSVLLTIILNIFRK